MKGRNLFILEQRVSLLESFLGHVNGAFLSEIESMLLCLKRELKFQKYKEKRNIIAMLLMFDLFKDKIVKKIRR